MYHHHVLTRKNANDNSIHGHGNGCHGDEDHGQELERGVMFVVVCSSRERWGDTLRLGVVVR